MAMPEVGLPNEPVPQTVTPLSAAAAMSIEALRMPVVIRSLRSGSFSMTARGKRGALAHGADDLEALQRLDHIVGPAEVLVEHLDVEVARHFRPVRRLERDILVIVEDCTAILGHVVLVLMQVRAGGSWIDPAGRWGGMNAKGGRGPVGRNQP